MAAMDELIEWLETHPKIALTHRCREDLKGLRKHHSLALRLRDAFERILENPMGGRVVQNEHGARRWRVDKFRIVYWILDELQQRLGVDKARILEKTLDPSKNEAVIMPIAVKPRGDVYKKAAKILRQRYVKQLKPKEGGK